MLKRIGLFVASVFLLLNIYGCFALLVGAAAGTGTAMWLSDKLTQEVNKPYEHTIEASREALKSLKLEITKETKTDEVAQIRSKAVDGKDVWIDIRKVSEESSKIEIRVGAVSSDKEMAASILKAIQKKL